MVTMGKRSGRVLICGIGNSIRGDEKVGPAAIKELESENLGEDVLLLDCGNTPRNYVSRALEFRPGRAIIISALDMGKSPGTIEVLEADDAKSMLMSGRYVGLQFFIGSLQGFAESVRFIAVQPRSTEPGSGMSTDCANAVWRVKETVLGIIGD